MAGKKQAERLTYGADGVWHISAPDEEEAGVPGLVYEGDGRWSVGPVVAIQEDNVWARFREFMSELDEGDRGELYNILTAWRGDDANPDVKVSTTAAFRGALGGPFGGEVSTRNRITDAGLGQMSVHAREHLLSGLRTAARLGYVRRVGDEYLPAKH